MKYFLLMLLTINSQLGAQPYTQGGYNQLYWDWRPDIAGNCYEFTYVNAMPVNSASMSTPLIGTEANLFYWNDCNYGKTWINSNEITNTFDNVPLHDTLFRVTSHYGIADTICGFDSPYQAGVILNTAQITSPLRKMAIFKGLIYLPEKCNQWHFAIGNIDDVTSWDGEVGYFLFNGTGSGYLNLQSNIDSMYRLTYGNVPYPHSNYARYILGCSFNNVDYPDNNSPRLISPPIYSFQAQNIVEFNPGLYDPDHDLLKITISDTIFTTDRLYLGTGWDYRFFKKNKLIVHKYTNRT